VCLHSEEIKGDHAYKQVIQMNGNDCFPRIFVRNTTDRSKVHELADASLPKFDQARFTSRNPTNPLQTPGDAATAAMRMLKNNLGLANMMSVWK